MGSDLLSILSSSGSSLAAHRAAVAVASHNIENVDTPGYARQLANLQAMAPSDLVAGGYIGAGVRLSSVTQARDRFLEAQIPAALGGSAYSTAQAQSLEAVSALDPQAAGSLGDALAAFYSSLRALGQDAGNSQLRQAAVSSARSLTVAFQRTHNALDSAQSGLDAQIGGVVGEVNQLAAEVARLNGAVSKARASGAEPNDLLDQRQKALDRLAEISGAVPVQDGSGNVNVSLGGRFSIVDGSLAGSLSTLPDPTNSAHLDIRDTPPGASTSMVLPDGALGGQLGGYLQARDVGLGTAVERLDDMAFELATAMNSVHQAGYGLDGITGRNLFDVGATPDDAAERIALTAAVAGDARALATASSASSLPGDARSLQALLATERQALPTSSLDPISTLGDITAQFGATTASARAHADQDGGLLEHLQTMRQATSGVSIDEELLAMQKAQRAYEAVAKVIQTSSDMLTTLMNLRP
jgi:flagellar hook-associated protein 1 FlgK